jgi:C4-dicarboxylate-specific signal transduction histidine kinase
LDTVSLLVYIKRNSDFTERKKASQEKKKLESRVQQAHKMEAIGTLADPTQIHQVLMNLCTNAEHAMRGNGGPLAVSLTDVAIDSEIEARQLGIRPGAYLRLEVRDTDNGMVAEVKERIFDPFFLHPKREEKEPIVRLNTVSIIRALISIVGWFQRDVGTFYVRFVFLSVPQQLEDDTKLANPTRLVANRSSSRPTN